MYGFYVTILIIFAVRVEEKEEGKVMKYRTLTDEFLAVENRGKFETF